MYNRYIPNSDGTYTRTQVGDDPPQQHADNPPPPDGKEAEAFSAAPLPSDKPKGGRFKQMMGNLLPNNMDLGDILVLVILILLLLDSDEDDFLIIIAAIIFLIL